MPSHHASLFVTCILILQQNAVLGYFFIGHNEIIFDKSIEMRGSLSVDGAVAANNGLSVTSGATTLGGSLTVNGASTLKAATTVANSPLQVTGAAGTLSVTGATSMGSTLGVVGATTLSNTLSVGGATTLSGALGVTGLTTLQATKVTNAPLQVTGASGSFSVSGASTLSGATSLGSTLDVSGATTLSSSLGVTGTSTLSGAASLSSTLGVTGTSTLGNLIVSGACTMTGGLTVNTCACGNMPVAPSSVTVAPTSANYQTLQAAWDALSGMVVLAPITITIAQGTYVSAAQVTLLGFTKHLITIVCASAVTVNDCTFSFSGTNGIWFGEGALVSFSNGFKVINTGTQGSTIGLKLRGAQLTVGILGISAVAFYTGISMDYSSMLKDNGPYTVSGVYYGISLNRAKAELASMTATASGYGVNCGSQSAVQILGVTNIDVSGTSNAYCIYAFHDSFVEITAGAAVFTGGEYSLYAGLSGQIVFSSTALVTVTGITNSGACLKAIYGGTISGRGSFTLTNCGDEAAVYASLDSLIFLSGLTFGSTGLNQYAAYAEYNGAIYCRGSVNLNSFIFASGYIIRSTYGGTVHLYNRINKHASMVHASTLYAADFCTAAGCIATD